MKQNIVTVLILLGLVTLSGLYGSYRNQQAPGPEGSASPSAETVVDGAAPPVSDGSRMGSLRLGDTRREVEKLNLSRGLNQAHFGATNLKGQFPSCPGHAEAIAYNNADLVVALLGRKLTLPDGSELEAGQKLSEVEKLLGPGTKRVVKDVHLVSLDYPARGLAFRVFGTSDKPDDAAVTAIELTAPWNP